MQKREAQDYKDREVDSDDEARKEMMTFDERLTYINMVDRKIFGVDEAKKEEAEKAIDQSNLNEKEIPEEKLPIILHEREIMENIENFVVTIICGETGSGKST